VKKSDQIEREMDAYLKRLKRKNSKSFWLKLSWTVPNLRGNVKLPLD
jgi:hypothetical protein